MEEEDAKFVQVDKAELSAIKRAPSEMQVRLAKEVEGATARCVPLRTLISTSSSIWLGVLASKTGDGALAATCHADGRQVAIRLAGQVGGRSAFQLQDTLSFQMLMETITNIAPSWWSSSARLNRDCASRHGNCS